MNNYIEYNVDYNFDNLYDVQDFRSPAWVAGTLSQTTGGVSNTHIDIRIRTGYVRSHVPYKVTLGDGYKIRIFYYNPSDNSFLYSSDWIYKSFNLYNDYKCTWKAIVAKIDDSTITVDNGANILFQPIYPKNYITKEYIEPKIYKSELININNTKNYFWNIETSKAILTSISSEWYAADPIHVQEGEIYTIISTQGPSDKVRIWTITDDDYNIISMCENYKGGIEHNETFEVPPNGTLLLLTKQSSSHTQTLYRQNTALNLYYGEPLLHKRLSLLGDSISAFVGTIPDGYSAYYNGTTRGVTSASQMWWSVLCEETGMVPCVINAWSGSGINWQTHSSHQNIVPMSDDSRCNNLHTEEDMPDIILIAGGVNDYTYAQEAQNEPLDWDGKTIPGYSEPSTGKYVYNSFTEAYAAMIKKLQTNYPDAIIVALSTWFTMRGDDNSYTLTHTVGNNTYTQKDYNDKIRYVAEQMYIPYIDVSNIGFNRNNFYPMYAQDSETTPTHPNAAGHAVMGKAIAKKLINLVKAYL